MMSVIPTAATATYDELYRISTRLPLARNPGFNKLTPPNTRRKAPTSTASCRFNKVSTRDTRLELEECECAFSVGTVESISRSRYLSGRLRRRGPFPGSHPCV